MSHDIKRDNFGKVSADPLTTCVNFATFIFIIGPDDVEQKKKPDIDIEEGCNTIKQSLNMTLFSLSCSKLAFETLRQR